MRKIYSLILTASCAAVLYAQQPQYHEIAAGVMMTDMSSDGKYVVGYAAGYEDDAKQKSWIFNSETGSFEWKTEYDKENLDKSGCFVNVNKKGTIVGFFKDKNFGKVIDDGGGGFAPAQKESPFDQEGYGVFNVAAIWKNGEVTSLGIGNLTIEQLADFTDGTVATAVSEDDKVVVGYTQLNWMPEHPCGWILNEDTQKYDFVEYVMPQAGVLGCINDVTADGSIAAGYVTINNYDGTGRTYPAVWTSSQECVTLKPDDLSKMENSCASVIALSADGRYALVQYSQVYFGVYDLQLGKFKKIELDKDIWNVKPFSIADNGDVLAKVSYNDYVTEETIYYSYEGDIIYDMNYYIPIHCEGLEVPANFRNATTMKMSADGKSFVGFENMSFTAYWLQINKDKAVLPPLVDEIEAFSSDIDKVTVKWKNATIIPDGMKLKAFEIYCDGELKETQPISTTEGIVDYYKYIVEGLKPGLHEFKVRGVYSTADGDVYSANKTAEVMLTNDNSIPFFEGFDNAGMLEPKDWTKDRKLENPLELADWIPCVPDYENITFFYACTISSTSPYESYLTSKVFDATNLSDVHMSIRYKMQPVTRDDYDYSTDYFYIEVSEDGENWTKIKEYRADLVEKYKWNFVDFDLSQYVANKTFKVRFTCKGSGISNLRWNLDNISLWRKSDMVDAPKGLCAATTDKEVTLRWSNRFNSDEISYLANTGRVSDQCVGNVGNPLITVISLSGDKLKDYDEQYFTSVSAFVYDGQYVGEENTQVDVVIFEDNKLICDQPVDRIFDYPNMSSMKLDTPIKIDASKEYKVGVGIHDYSATITPLYYSIQEAETGKSDLFSEDDGETWQALYDIYGPGEEYDQYRNCVWDITANVNATADVDLEIPDYYENELVGYNVYRNGELMNTHAIYKNYLKFVDESPLSEAEYTVQAFYNDGSVSELSEPLFVKLASVKAVPMANMFVYPNPTVDIINVVGEFDLMEIFDMSGTLLKASKEKIVDVSELSAGLYIVKLINSDNVSTVRLIKK